MPDLPPLFEGLPPASRHQRRTARPAPSLIAQCTFPHRPDAPRPRGDPRRDLRCVEPRLARAITHQPRPVMSPILPLFAQAAPAAGGSGMSMIILQLALIGLIFYFRMIRPPTKQRKEQENSFYALRKGDEIVTVGGVVGDILHIKE